MIGRVRVVAVMAVCLAWAGVALGEGLYWESTTTGIGAPRTAQTYAMPKMMKIVQADGHVVIVRIDQDKLVNLDTKKQTYQEHTFAEMEATMKAMQPKLDAARAEMEKRLKDMSPEQRAMVEKMMPKMPGAGAVAAAPVEVKSTAETKTIGGYACTKYVATSNGKTELVAWTTPDVKGFASLHDDWLALQKRMANMQKTFGGGIAEAYAKIQGFPMQTEMGGVTTTVTKVEPRSTPASEFDVPAGYKKEASPVPRPDHP